ncbi:MAG: helix-turn-helix domain-containing protein [Verrucomicrobia bacterium]|nr:helix-turn-helix domain-containing protein [Verrucomicrobiota bacterium]MDE3099466.1 helix-turn-helix domain-containing protein [Verrucomicrobiota bacterium]
MACFSHMRPVFARGNQRTAELLLEMRTQAANDGQPRVAQRFHGIALSIEGRTVSEIARVLNVHRTSVPLWIEHWNQHQERGLLEGHRSGRPGELTARQCQNFPTCVHGGLFFRRP